MPLVRIEDLSQFEALKPAWDALAAADEQAHTFVSWAWLRGYYDTTRSNWLIFGYKPPHSQDYAAFLPLAYRIQRAGGEKALFLGAAQAADYTGMVCLPGFEEEVLDAFAAAIQKLSWDSFLMHDIMDQRMLRLPERFEGKKYQVEQGSQTLCPYIPLPASWDEYIHQRLSKNTRHILRHDTRKFEAIPGLRVSDAQPDTFDRHMSAILDLWEQRWGHRPEVYRPILRRCFEQDSLWLTVYWDGEIPVAGKAAFVDRPRQTIRGFLTTYNLQYAHVSPGMVSNTRAICRAIERGFKVYDFMRGVEPYKLSLGAEMRHAATYTIRQNGLQRQMARSFKKALGVGKAARRWFK